MCGLFGLFPVVIIHIFFHRFCIIGNFGWICRKGFLLFFDFLSLFQIIFLFILPFLNFFSYLIGFSLNAVCITVRIAIVQRFPVAVTCIFKDTYGMIFNSIHHIRHYRKSNGCKINMFSVQSIFRSCLNFHAGTGHGTLIPYFFKTLCILNWNRKSGIAETIFMYAKTFIIGIIVSYWKYQLCSQFHQTKVEFPGLFLKLRHFQSTSLRIRTLLIIIRLLKFSPFHPAFISTP